MIPSFLSKATDSLTRILNKTKSTTTDQKKVEETGPGLKPASWYDKKYSTSPEYQKHYSESVYYFLWTVVSDRILHSEYSNILDLGCGPGQFAHLLRDKGIRNYCGLDFSAESIDMAKSLCPNFIFQKADICEQGVIESFEYDCVVTLEFLEHIENDVSVLKRLKADTRVIASVPNFPAKSHVRYFSNLEEVKTRYSTLFKSFNVDYFLMNETGTTFYLIEGIR